jgi:hypothetical protein
MGVGTGTADTAGPALTPAHVHALGHVHTAAAGVRDAARDRIAAALGSGPSSLQPTALAGAMRERGRVALHFHPTGYLRIASVRDRPLQTAAEAEPRHSVLCGGRSNNAWTAAA